VIGGEKRPESGILEKRGLDILTPSLGSYNAKITHCSRLLTLKCIFLNAGKCGSEKVISEKYGGL
jgi:hypothetical protein